MNVASDAAFDMIETCLRSCRNTCLSCNQIGEEGVVQGPGRLVELGIPGTSNDLMLIEASGRAISEYVALSYCWGDPCQPEATTTGNVNSRLRGFSSSAMPKSIIDAFMVARRLGFQCIWIDSLCIIQDSGDDKTAEIKKMKAIYESASLTIVAASANDVNDGFLQARRRDAAADVEQVPFWRKYGAMGAVNLRYYDEASLQEEDPIHTPAGISKNGCCPDLECASPVGSSRGHAKAPSSEMAE